MARRRQSRAQKESLATTPQQAMRQRASTPTAAAPRGSGLSLPVAASVLAVICLAAYWNSFRAPFLLDNGAIILKDPRLRSVDWQSVWNIFTLHYWWPAFESRLFRPVTTLSYWLNYSVLGNGENPFGYHAVNLLLHWLNGVLAFSLVRAITRRPGAAFAAAVVLVVHPLTVESVTNVVGRADLLAGMSVVGGLLLYRQFLTSGGSRSAAALAGLGAICLAGVFCKESAVVLPGVMLLHDVAFPADGAASKAAAVRRWLARAWPAYGVVLFALAVLAWARWMLFRYSPLSGEFGSDNLIAIAPAWTGVMTAVKVAGYYLALLVWPAKLSCDYSYNAVTLFGGTLSSGQDPHAWLAMAALIGLATGAAFAWRRDRAVFFFLGFAAAAFLPTSNLLFPIGTIMAERLMYLPLLGLAAAASLTLAALGGRVLDLAPSGARLGVKVAWTIAVVAWLAAFFARTVVRNGDWTEGQRFWASSARAAPDSVKVIRGLAAVMMASDPSGGRVDDALEIAARGLRITEQVPLPLAHMPAALFEEVGAYCFGKATQLSARGEVGQAQEMLGQSVAMLERAERIDREISRLGRERLLRLGRRPEDIPDTGKASIYTKLGAAYMAQGKPDRAVEALRHLRLLQPVSVDALFELARAEGAGAEVERGKGQPQQSSDLLEQAAVHLIEALLLSPGHDASLRALESVYDLLAAPPGAIQAAGGTRTLNLDHPVLQRHFRKACVQLVRDLAVSGQAERAAEWQQRMIGELQVPAELFDTPRKGR
jgi:tetratricopeptide (TPR) repeat protein